MKRRFAIPAAIALAAHALLFVGSGKPPTEPKGKIAPITATKEDKNLEEEFLIKVVEEVRRDAVDPNASPDKGGGGDPDDSPPVCPDIPRPELLTAVSFIQEVSSVTSGNAKVVPTIGVRRPSGEGTGWGDAAVSAAMLDNPPRTRFQKAPVYPYAMKTSGTPGTVWVEFLVDEAGRVHNVRVVKSTRSDFEEATLAAVADWKFEPGKRKGTPVSFRMSVPVVFAMSD